MPRKPQQRESVAPAISPHRATELIRRQVARAGDIRAMRFNDPEAEVWFNSTMNILDQAFGQPSGEPHPNTTAFAQASSGMQRNVFDDAQRLQQHHVARTDRRTALLDGFIEQLQDLAPPSTVLPGSYTWHSEIARVSGQLFRDGHYKQAALEAYIRVIDQVRAVSGITEDGDPLMNKSFGADKQSPVIQFNGLSTEADRDEQRGFLYLFKGIVGLRNLKAHSNRLFDDASRAHEYLALASLLMRVLEIAQVNRMPGSAKPAPGADRAVGP